jgi:hypothetical protein
MVRGGAFREWVERMLVPGAMASGLKRPSWVGPRLLKAAMPSALSATGSSWIGGFGNPDGSRFPYVGKSGSISRRTDSLAPTVMQFLAAASEPTSAGSTRPSPLSSVPLLPADRQITRSGWFQTNSSISVALWSYGWLGNLLPHEFVWTRAVITVGRLKEISKIGRDATETAGRVKQ